MSNSRLDEAKKIIGGLVEQQKRSTDKMENMNKKVADLQKAYRQLCEASTPAHKAETLNDEYLLKSYTKENGDIRWIEEKGTVATPMGNLPIIRDGLLDAENITCQWQGDLIKIASQRKLARSMMSHPHTPKLDSKLHSVLSKAPKVLKPSIEKVFNDASGTGADWIPDQFIPDLYQTFELPKRLRSLLPTVEVERNTILVPRMERGGRPYIKGQLTIDDPLAKYTASTVSTAQKSVAIKGLADRFIIDDSAAEDSAIALMPALSRQIAADLEDAFEDCMINGDTTAVHADAINSWNIRSRWGATGLGTSSDHRRMFLGFRQASFDKGTQAAAAATFTYAEFMAVLFRMGEIGTDDVIAVVSPEVYLKNILTMDNVATVDKYGPSAAVLTGEVARIAGIPIVLSRFIGSDMAATGLFTGVAGARPSGLVMFNRSSWYQYVRRGILVEQQKSIASGAIELVATLRAVMDSPDAASTKNCSYAFDMG